MKYFSGSLRDIPVHLVIDTLDRFKNLRKIKFVLELN
jgi:hypothetical protein